MGILVEPVSIRNGVSILVQAAGMIRLDGAYGMNGGGFRVLVEKHEGRKPC